MSAVVVRRVVFLFVSRQLHHSGGTKHASTCFFIIAADKAGVNAKMPPFCFAAFTCRQQSGSRKSTRQSKISAFIGIKL
jgi:hypothetical protein